MATEKELRKDVSTWLNQYKGIKEGSSEHKEILAIFNDSKLCTRYKMTVDDAWCAAAASAAFIACNLTDIFPCVECSCSKMISLAQTAGIWNEDDSYTPNIGDCILYDWGDSGSGDNRGNPDHVGIVQDVTGTTISVIEGNKSNTVGTRTIEVNGKYIRGYIVPKFASAATETDTAGESAGTVGTLKVGDIVTFNGTAHYTSANATNAKSCKSGKAEITQICKGAKHPYHLIHAESGCTVYGWVNESDIAEIIESAATEVDTAGSTSTALKIDTASSRESGHSKGTSLKTTANVNFRTGAGTSKTVIKVLSKGTAVTWYGYYTKVSGTKWYLVQDKTGQTGFISSAYLS